MIAEILWYKYMPHAFAKRRKIAILNSGWGSVAINERLITPRGLGGNARAALELFLAALANPNLGAIWTAYAHRGIERPAKWPRISLLPKKMPRKYDVAPLPCPNEVLYVWKEEPFISDFSALRELIEIALDNRLAFMAAWGKHERSRWIEEVVFIWLVPDYLEAIKASNEYYLKEKPEC